MPYNDRLAAKTNEFVVEKMEMRMTALTSDGKTGMPNRFIAAISRCWMTFVEQWQLTDDVWTLGGTGRPVCDSAQQIRIVRSGYDTNAERTSDVEEQQTPDSRLERSG